MDLELKAKNEKREEAVQFMNKFNADRQRRIAANKKNNQKLEAESKREEK